MNNLKKLIHEYQKKVPDNNPVAFVSGISSVACWLADFPESEWGGLMDAMMDDVGDYHAEESRAAKFGTNPALDKHPLNPNRPA